MYFLVDSLNKIIFGWNGKCGCSHVKNLFYYLTDDKPFTDIHRRSSYNNLPVDHSKYNIIIVTRNPYNRIVSGFIDKYISGNFELKAELSLDTLTFDNFTEEITKTSFNIIDHHHFAPQLSDKWNSDILNNRMVKYYDINHIDYDYISFLYNGKIIPDEVKNYRGDHTIKYIEKYDKEVYNEHYSVYKGKSVPIELFYNDEIKKRVYSIYQRDFIFLEAVGIKYDFGITLINQPYLDTVSLMKKFTFVKGKDQPGYDMFRIDNNTTLMYKLLEALSSDKCKAINTLGFMKTKVDNLVSTLHIRDNIGGIYIKNC